MPAAFPPNPKNNATTADPTSSNNSGQGYAVGSTWTNTTSGRRFACVDATTAIWDPMDWADHPGYVTSNFYWPYIGVASATSTTHALNTVYFIPFMVKARISVANIAFKIVAAGGTGNMGIFASDATTKKPTGTPLAYNNASITMTGGAATQSVALNATIILEPGLLYYTGVNVDTTTTTFTVPGVYGTGSYVGSTTANDVLANTTFKQTFTFAALSGFTAAPGSITSDVGSSRGAGLILIGTPL